MDSRFMHYICDHGIHGVVLTQIHHAWFFMGSSQRSPQKRSQILV